MNVLVIGLGSIAKKHIAALRQLFNDVTIYALRSSGKDAYEYVININSFSELKVKPDFAIISNPTSLHAQSIIDAMQLNCPLFIEKPALASLEDADDIMERLLQRSILTYVACNLRFHPVINFIKNSLRHRINEVNIYCGSYLPAWRPSQDYTQSYSANASMGGGVQLDLIHEIDYAYWLFGKPDDVISVARKTSELKIDSCDFAAYHLLYSQFTVNITLNYYRRNAKRTIEILTDDGSLHADLLACTVADQDGQLLFSDENYSIANTYVEQLKYFTDQINHNKQPMNGFSEAVEVLKIALNEQVAK